MDIDALDRALADAFDAGDGERRAVARMACDLAATGRYANVTDHELTPEVVVANLQDAPDDGLASKWNWWLGALEVAFGRQEPAGGFAEFQVRRYERDEREGTGESHGSDGGDREPNDEGTGGDPA